MIIRDLFEVRYPLASTDQWYGNLDYKARGGRLVSVTPDQYLAQVRPLDIDETSRDNIDDLKRHIQSGRTLDPLAIYADGKEDGRHRAYAAKELGIRRVPVIDFRKPINEAARLASVEDIGSSGLKRQIYHIPNVPGLEASLRVLDYGEREDAPGRVVQTIEIHPEEMQGKGYAQQLYLAALADGPINERPQFRSEPATRAVERLISKGLVVRNGDVLTLAKSMNEAAEEDFNSAGLAQEWAYKFTNWLEQHNTNTPLGEIDDFRYWQVPSHDGVKIDMLYLSGWRLGLPDDISFGIGWTKDGNDASVRGYLLQGLAENRRHYYVVLMANHDPRQETEVIWQLNVSSLPHEITHYFDYKRGMAAALSRQRLKAKKADIKPQVLRPARYYNDPLEFNAHFQQAMASIFTSLSSIVAQKAVYGEPSPLKWLDSFAAFYQHFRKTSDQQKYQFLQHLSLRNRQKIIRRLYKLYGFIKQQWPNIPAVQRQAADFITRWTERDKREAAKETA